MENLIKQISDIGVVPVIKIDNAKDAVPLAAALKRGGLCCAEVTFRTDAAEESIKRIAKEYPDFLVAAGTVLTPEQAEYNQHAPIHMTSVDTDPRLCAEERRAIIQRLGVGAWQIFGAHGFKKDYSVSG